LLIRAHRHLSAPLTRLAASKHHFCADNQCAHNPRRQQKQQQISNYTQQQQRSNNSNAALQQQQQQHSNTSNNNSRKSPTMSVESLRDMIINNDEDGIRKLLPSISPEAATLVNSPMPLPSRKHYPTFKHKKTEEGAPAPAFSALHYAVVNLFAVHKQGLSSAKRQ
jgi:hypothetical protein